MRSEGFISAGDEQEEHQQQERVDILVKKFSKEAADD